MRVHSGILQTCVTKSDSEGICAWNTPGTRFLYDWLEALGKMPHYKARKALGKCILKG